MSFVTKLRDYLKDNKVDYIMYYHNPTYTSTGLAKCLQVPTKELAKSVVIKIENGYAMIVLPACRRLNLNSLKSEIFKSDVKLAGEDELENLFPDCELGAVPPFGNLYDIPVYAESALDEDYEIVFNAGTHTDAIKMKYDDYKRLVKPYKIEFSKN